MKVCTKQFPQGYYKGQRGDGFYIDRQLNDNLTIMARSIVKDMQFTGICTGKDIGVRVGKSSFVQQVGSAWTELVNVMHGLNLTFNERNVVFKANDLMERAMQLPPYSCLILDEGDDLALHYFNKVAVELRKFFRKCGQLNLFIILILPDFFELPKGYAIIRTNFLVTIKFEGEFDRGYFEFFSYPKKKELYLKGKKTMDYGCVEPNIDGRFFNLYTIDKKKYDETKRKDLEEDVKEARKKKVLPSPEKVTKDTKRKFFLRAYKRFNELINVQKLSECFEITEPTGYNWINGIEDEEEKNNFLKSQILENGGNI